MAEHTMSNDEWEEVAQDIPSLTDPFLQQYLTGRANLIAQEKRSRSDVSFIANLSPIAKRACDIVERIRDHENAQVWTPQVEEEIASVSNECIFPGMMFMLAKDRMEKTNLWKIVRNMPKGSLLHAHLDAMVNFDFLFEELMNLPGMHISSSLPLDSESARKEPAISFRYRANEKTDGSIWASDYKKDDFILLTKSADEFPQGGRPGFLKWLKSLCTLSLNDSHNQHHGIDAIWRKFAKCFEVVATIIHYEPMFRAFLRQLMKTLKDDGVNWVEVR